MSLVVISATLGVLGADRPACAEGVDAGALFDQGNDLMQQGKLAQACEAFEASNRAEPTAGTLIQLGKCLWRRDRIASAWLAYKDALSRAKDPGKRKVAADAVAALESRLSYLTISVPDKDQLDQVTIMRDGTLLAPASWNLALPVDGNDYTIVARLPGHEPWQTTVHVEVERDKVVVEIPPLEGLPTATEANPVVLPPVLPNGIAQTPASPLSTTRKIAIGLGGASMLGLATAAALGTVARREQADASRLCPGAPGSCAHSAEANVLVRAGNRWAFDANVAWSIAGAAALASGVLWLIGAPTETPGTQISVVPAGATGEIGVVVVRSSSW
jgi:hypothetical protein